MSSPRSIGLYLFLLALGVLFAASMLGYVLIRTQSPQAPPPGSLHLPGLLFLSTTLILLSSLTFQGALTALRRERQAAFRAYLLATLALALGFLLVQTPALLQLLAQHRALQARGLHLYGLVFFLILLHALHVFGGLVALLRLLPRALRGRYDHEHYEPVRYALLYWHFLDAVWIVMFLLLWLTS